MPITRVQILRRNDNFSQFRIRRRLSMRGNIETIKFTAVISAIFAFLSYFITLNMELAFFAPQWSWISNNFALTVCGGVFTSTLVVLFCEVQKYLSNKADCEQYLFYQTMYLYSLIFQMQKNIEEYIENKEESVPEGLLEKPAQMAQSQVNAIRSIDYVTFRKQNSLVIAHRNFCTVKLLEISLALEYWNYLKRAILSTKIFNLQETGHDIPITSANTLIGQTLVIIREKYLSLLNDLSNYLETVDQACSNRFGWNEMKFKISESYISIFNLADLKTFLAQGKDL